MKWSASFRCLRGRGAQKKFLFFVFFCEILDSDIDEEEGRVSTQKAQREKKRAKEWCRKVDIGQDGINSSMCCYTPSSPFALFFTSVYSTAADFCFLGKGSSRSICQSRDIFGRDHFLRCKWHPNTLRDSVGVYKISFVVSEI
ncbi:hypothetical protein AVEN_58659-1 [Araneus ventricosus]|uniref:Uncharacterized protein n=1 Tax=Araneus ventricosus TaxID=182803 RepID=A0A4Y2L5R6_ARAVE|nr:hypothetical protein AVEN_58659-1 [Araneus ventricosus]